MADRTHLDEAERELARLRGAPADVADNILMHAVGCIIRHLRSPSPPPSRATEPERGGAWCADCSHHESDHRPECLVGGCDCAGWDPGKPSEPVEALPDDLPTYGLKFDHALLKSWPDQSPPPNAKRLPEHSV